MSFVQGASANTGAASVASFTVTLGGVATGNTVWGIVAVDHGNTVTASIGGVSFNLLDNITDGGNGTQFVDFILGNISGTPTLVTINLSPNARGAAVFIEESGCLAASNPTDVHTGLSATIGASG